MLHPIQCDCIYIKRCWGDTHRETDSELIKEKNHLCIVIIAHAHNWYNQVGKGYHCACDRPQCNNYDVDLITYNYHY